MSWPPERGRRTARLPTSTDPARVYCFDTDVLSAVIRRDPPLHLIRRLARTPPNEQCTTAITLGELVYGVQRRGSQALAARVQELIASAGVILPFDEPAGRIYAPSWSSPGGESPSPTCGSRRSR
jgi:hypothetical protein